EDGIRGKLVTGVQTCALPISCSSEGELAREAEFGLSEFVAPATEVAVGAEREHDEILGGEHAREYAYLFVVDDHLIERAEARVRSEERRVGKGCRSRWGGGRR